ncbi:hypothetical protein D9757_014943 [Collybiopsis confluens]|uniref:Ubiquitin-like protease family profile domain-containing protein n=1 Tax=Collybiopsis confluens TaxID=2823264 RepID=A0A8H5CTY4_9AGAR|nr:hypothetical protein D9757_014943 [Collybiopsis confluens]
MSNTRSTRLVYQRLLSPSEVPQSHKNCTLIDIPPFGHSRTCMKPLFEQMLNIINSCSSFTPSICLNQLLGLASMERIGTLLSLDFPLQEATCSDQFYLESNFHIRQLNEAAKILSKNTGIQAKIERCLNRHDTLPSDNNALIVIQNLNTLYECINKRRLIKEKVNATDFRGKLPFVQLRNFHTLGVGRWVDDEVINYFVRKWCSKSSTTIGFSTFFAGKVLFQESTCVNPKSMVTKEDELCLKGWYDDAAKGIPNWDSVFIPINKAGMHWYSARIDYHLKRIDIYDSLEDRYIANRKKPVLLRRNAKLMMILMWLTEVLGQLRGESVDLTSDSERDWSLILVTERFGVLSMFAKADKQLTQIELFTSDNWDMHPHTPQTPQELKTIEVLGSSTSGTTYDHCLCRRIQRQGRVGTTGQGMAFFGRDMILSV